MAEMLFTVTFNLFSVAFYSSCPGLVLSMYISSAIYHCANPDAVHVQSVGAHLDAV